MAHTKKKISSLLTVLISLILIVLLYPKLQHPAYLRALIVNLGWSGILLDLLIVSLQMLFPIVPFPLLAGINIVVFGWVMGFAISLSGSLLGSSLGFWLARSLGREWAQARLSKLEKWANFSHQKSFYLIVLARLTPFFPAAAVNYAAGLSRTSFLLFFGASLLGKIPMIAWESWIGHDFWQFTHHPKRFTGALVFGIIIFGGIWLFWHIYEQKQIEKR